MFIRKAVCLLLNQIAAFDKIWCKGVDMIVWTTTKLLFLQWKRGTKLVLQNVFSKLLDNRFLSYPDTNKSMIANPRTLK